MSERHGELTTKGNPLTLVGNKVAVGDVAPDFTVRGLDQKPVSLSDFDGRVKLISVVPSLDTGICEAQTLRFNEEASKMADDVVILTISAEHPFNQRRWCGTQGVDDVVVLSDHYDMAFGNAYGTHIKEWRLNQRSIFVVGRDGTITYVEYVPEIAQFPDYESALEATRAAAS